MSDQMHDLEISAFASRLSRRSALRWGLGAVTALNAIDLIEACGAGPASSTSGRPTTDPNKVVTLTYAAPTEDSGTTVKLVDQWNAANPKTQVKYQAMPKTSADDHTLLVPQLTAKSPTPDVMDVDVIWPGEFASAKWVQPLTPYLTSAFQSQLFPSAVQAGTFNGKVHAIQRWYDSGQMYYRSDLLSKYGLSVPKTTDELVTAARKIQDGERASDPNFWGWAFPGAKIEAVFDHFLELFWSLGGEIVDRNNKIQLNTANGLRAAQFMYDAVYTHRISPPGTSTYKPADLNNLYQQGHVAFMRNWQFSWALIEDPKQSKVSGKNSLASIPGLSSAQVGQGCTGGWMLAINANSMYPDRAWQFIQYLESPKAQITMATSQSVSPVRPDAFNDSTVQSSQNGFFKLMAPVLKQTKGRPQIANYAQVSALIQTELNAMMANQKKPADALKAAQAAVDAVQNS